MELTTDTVAEYVGYFGKPALAHVRIFEQQGEQPVVIVGELDDNPGTSITNVAESVAQMLHERFFGDGREFRYIEFYPDSGGTYDAVTFAVAAGSERSTEWIEPVVTDEFVLLNGTPPSESFGEPKWRHLGKAAAEALVGQKLPEWPLGGYTQANCVGKHA